MALPDKNFEDDYISIHHLVGDREGIEYLRATSRTILERLCFEARRDGQTKFFHNDIYYLMTKERDGSFFITPEEQVDELID